MTELPSVMLPSSLPRASELLESRTHMVSVLTPEGVGVLTVVEGLRSIFKGALAGIGAKLGASGAVCGRVELGRSCLAVDMMPFEGRGGADALVPLSSCSTARVGSTATERADSSTGPFKIAELSSPTPSRFFSL